MPNVPYSITPNAITVVVGNRPKVVTSKASNFSALAAELRKPVHDVDLIAELADISLFVARATFGEVQIADGQVRWRGEAVKSVVADRLIELLKVGQDLKPLANFLGRVMLNPLQTARDELFLWLESGSQPITPEGMILAFKKVRGDYKDIYTGTIDNSIGQKPSMPRDLVDPDRATLCSSGLHFCSYGYLSQFGSNTGTRIMIVLVDPADVVAIPDDYSNQKGRACQYEVIGEVPVEAAGTFFEGHPVVQPYSPQEDEFDSSIEEDECDEDVENEENEDDIEGTDVVVIDIEVTSAIGGASIYHFEDTPVIDPAPAPIVMTDSPPVEIDNDEPVAETPAGKPTLMFSRDGRSFLASEITALLKEHGQRGASRLTGIPRTTLQEWNKAIQSQATA